MPKLKKLNIVSCVQKDRTLAVATQASILHEWGQVKGARGGSAIYIILCDFPGEKVYGGGGGAEGSLYYSTSVSAYSLDLVHFLDLIVAESGSIAFSDRSTLHWSKSFHTPAQSRPYRAAPLITVIYNNDCASLELHRLAR